MHALDARMVYTLRPNIPSAADEYYEVPAGPRVAAEAAVPAKVCAYFYRLT